MDVGWKSRTTQIYSCKWCGMSLTFLRTFCGTTRYGHPVTTATSLLWSLFFSWKKFHNLNLFHLYVHSYGHFSARRKCSLIIAINTTTISLWKNTTCLIAEKELAKSCLSITVQGRIQYFRNGGGVKARSGVFFEFLGLGNASFE